MSRCQYEIVNYKGRWAIIRRLANGNVAGYDAVADRNQEQRHFAIHGSWAEAAAAADSRTYATEDAARKDVPVSSSSWA